MAMQKKKVDNQEIRREGEIHPITVALPTAKMGRLLGMNRIHG